MREVKIQHKNKIDNKDESVTIDMTWECVGRNSRTSARGRLGYYNLKQNIPWFSRSKWTDKILMVAESEPINGGNIRHEISQIL